MINRILARAFAEPYAKLQLNLGLYLRNGVLRSTSQQSFSYSTSIRPQIKEEVITLGRPEIEKEYSNRRYSGEARVLIEKTRASFRGGENKWARQNAMQKIAATKERSIPDRLPRRLVTQARPPSLDTVKNNESQQFLRMYNGQAGKDKRRIITKKLEESERKPNSEKRLREERERDMKNLAIEKPKPRKSPPTITSKVQRDVYIPDMVSVANLAKIFNVRLDNLTRTMNRLEMTNTNHDFLLTADDASLLALDYDLNPIIDNTNALDLYPRPKSSDMSTFPLRPPVVTIMGHVDHGKTTLLDTLRKTSVAAVEAGGITQHIGAFSVALPSSKRITFLDTPGHAAFSAMRARGAHVTDIVVLVVAADDGVMPQTIEAIKHAQDAGVPIIVAINKCDKHDANPAKTKSGLAQHGLLLEELGGETQAVEVSGLTGKGLSDLEEAIVTLAEVLDLRADIQGGSEGVVLESQTEKGRGHVATVLVQRGVLKSGAVVIAGTTWCKVKTMIDDSGKILKEALPGTPVKVIGWKDLPKAGDEMLEAKNENLAKTIIDNRAAKLQREEQLKDLDVINEKRRIHHEEDSSQKEAERARKKQIHMFHQGILDQYPAELELSTRTSENVGKDGRKELRVIIKGDVSGTVEAIVASLEGLQNKEVRVEIIHSGVGDIILNDVQLAATARGKIIGFNVKADRKIQIQAQQSGVPILHHNIIYNLLDDVKSQLILLLPPIIETRVNGEAIIQQIFEVNVKGKGSRFIAGCRINNGGVTRKGLVRILRDKKHIWEGKLESLKQFKLEIAEAKKGQECGICFDGFTDFKDGDTIQSIEYIETARTL